MNQCINCQKDTKNPKFCSKSCSAIVNGKLYPKRKRGPNRLYNCANCNQKLNSTQSKYCCISCQQDYQFKESLRLETNSAYTTKKYLLSLKGNKCNICKLSIWNRQPIPIELDHIDGNSENNHLDNLRLICPNCHAQTSTYKGANKGKGRHSRKMRYQEGKSY